ncbi:TonB-dependent receptor [Catalinimonas sp. 4WD22]|uniref:SusC/RagA family TonB-linked outer membrane protein n=1 Tax=Catalinimonas locisalis TaxID=3133978 RepID=UPI0031016315
MSKHLWKLNKLLIWGVVLIISHNLQAQGIASIQQPAGLKLNNDQQENQKSLQENQKSLVEVLSELEDIYQVSFDYDLNMLKEKKVAKIGQEKYPENLEVYLNKIFKPLNLKYKKYSDNTFLIFEAPKKIQLAPASEEDTNEKSDTRKVNLLKPLSRKAALMMQSMDQTVSGKVIDQDNSEPLPGVNVVVKNTTIGTVTDVDGNYRITVPTGYNTLVFSSVGYLSAEYEVGNQSTIDVSLTADVQSLSEVVVVGYGTQMKRDITGSIATIKSEDLSNFKAAPSLDQALQGQAAGVQVTSTSGVPGAPSRVLIRGTNSISSGTEPLWIIDGMILSGQGGGELDGFSRNANTVSQNPLATINPNDIESIEVLKDAAATAIYGSRGANGVVIVTTKSGKGAKGTTDVSLNYGVTNVLRGPQEIGFVDGPTWLSVVDESRVNRGLPLFDPNTILNDARDPNAVLSREQIANTNWFDEALRQGSFMDFNLSTSNSTEKANYYLSGNYREDEGIQVGSRIRRISTRANVDFRPSENFSVGSRINLSYTNNRRAPNGGAPGGNSNIALGGYDMANSGALPILPIFHPTLRDTEGNPILFDPLSGRNLRASLNRNNYINDLETYRAIGGLNLSYQLPFVEGLSLRSELSFDLIQSNNVEWGNTVIRENSKYAFDFSSTFRRLNYNLYASYDRNFGNLHNIGIVAGVESTEQQNRARNIEAQELFGEAPEVGAPGDVQRVSAGLGGEIYFRGFFGRLNYKLKDRYLLGFSFRRDASSVFAPEERWGNFLAASAGWILSEESFFQNIEPIEFLKVRASFGQTGNSSIDPLGTTTGYAGWGRYGDVGAGDLLTRIGNQAITWETTNSVDVGVDFELYENRISGTVAYYQQDAKDLLLQVEVPQSSGIFANNPRIWNNIGDLRNQGWEFTINTINIDRGGFTWSSSLNFTTNRNEVQKLTGGEGEELYNVNSNALVTKAGESLGFFRLAEYAGIDPEGGYELIYEMDLERFAETGERVRTGNTIPATRGNLSNHLFDFTEKTGLPTYFGGFTNNFRYKGFELSAMLAFSGGNYIYDLAERSQAYVYTGGGIIRSDIVGNTWTTNNRDADWPQLSWNQRYDVINEDGSITADERFDNQRSGQVHDKFLKKGDYLRMRTLQLAYNLPTPMMERLKLSGVRVYVSANNLFTITGYDGYDPEAVNLGGAEGRNLGQGWIGVTLPQVRSWNVGATISF